MTEMKELTSHERVRRFLRREPVDRIPVYESFWPETMVQWAKEGHVKEGAAGRRTLGPSLPFGARFATHQTLCVSEKGEYYIAIRMSQVRGDVYPYLIRKSPKRVMTLNINPTDFIFLFI